MKTPKITPPILLTISVLTIFAAVACTRESDDAAAVSLNVTIDACWSDTIDAGMPQDSVPVANETTTSPQL